MSVLSLWLFRTVRLYGTFLGSLLSVAKYLTFEPLKRAFVLLRWLPGRGGEGTPYICHVGRRATPKGMVIGPFCSENGYTVYGPWSGRKRRK